jgi:hypothetical protein
MGLSMKLRHLRATDGPRNYRGDQQQSRGAGDQDSNNAPSNAAFATVTNFTAASPGMCSASRSA